MIDMSSINSYSSDIITSAMKQKQEQQKVNSFEEELNKAAESNDETKLKEACQEFESYFINYIFKQMQNSVYSINNGEGLIRRSQGEEIFTEMLNEEYSKRATKQGGIGLADMMYKQLSQNLNTVSKIEDTKVDSVE